MDLTVTTLILPHLLVRAKAKMITTSKTTLLIYLENLKKTVLKWKCMKNKRFKKEVNSVLLNIKFQISKLKLYDR